MAVFLCPSEGDNSRPYNGRKGTIISASLPNGTIFSIAATYGPAIPFTALTNAAPPQATATAHGLTNSDVLEVTSGWPLINDRPSRVAASAANTFSLEGFDTTDLIKYPVGGGLGSVRKVLTWQQISQVIQNASSGGEQQSVEWVYLEDGIERSKNTFKKAKVLTLTLADDPAQGWNAVLLAADQDGKNRILRAALPNGGFLYYNVNVGFDPEPKLDANQIMTVTATFRSQGRFIRYAS